MSTMAQRKMIGCLRAKLGLSDDLYRELLITSYNVQSSKELTNAAAEIFLKNLKQKAIESGIWKPTKKYAFQKYKYNNETVVQGMATPAQKRKIEAMWYEVSKQTDDTSRAEALKAMIKRITGKDHAKFMTSKDVSKMINALKNMKGTKND